MWYNIDYKRLVVLLLPSFLRRPMLVSYLHVLVTPVGNLYQKWIGFRAENLYKIEHTGQVYSLENVLNDAFSKQDRLIYLTGSSFVKQRYLYSKLEEKPIFLNEKMYLYQKTAYQDNGYDFFVFVPKLILKAFPYQLKTFVDFYKRGGSRYIFQPIEDGVVSDRKYLWLNADKKSKYLGALYLWKTEDY